MKLSEAIALFERCWEHGGDPFGLSCNGCPLAEDVSGYPARACTILISLEEDLKDMPVPATMAEIQGGGKV